MGKKPHPGRLLSANDRNLKLHWPHRLTETGQVKIGQSLKKKWYNFTSSPLIPEYESAKPATLSPWSIYTYIDWRSHGFLISQKSLTGHTQNLAPLRILTNKLPSITDRGDVGSTHLPLLLLISHTRHVETPFSPFEVWMNPKWIADRNLSSVCVQSVNGPFLTESRTFH